MEIRDRALKSQRIGDKSRTFSTRTRSSDFVSETERIIMDIKPITQEIILRIGCVRALKRKFERRDSTRSCS